MKNTSILKPAAAVIIFTLLVALTLIIVYPKFHTTQASPTDSVIKLEQAVNNADMEQVKALFEPSMANKVDAVENLLAAFTGINFDKVSGIAKAVSLFNVRSYIGGIPEIRIETKEVILTSDDTSDVNVSVYSYSRADDSKKLLLDCCMKMVRVDDIWYLAAIKK